jgi:hypothetical protein
MKDEFEDRSEGKLVAIGLFVFLIICLIASWLGERMHDPEDYYKGSGSYLEEACPDCNQP